MTRISPYEGLPPGAFWRTGLAEAAYPPPGLYQPRWRLSPADRIVTAGSCFAQHVGRALRRAGYGVIDGEPAPAGMDAAQAAAQGYGLYSARYGNLYTTRQLRQLLDEAFGAAPDFDAIWQRDGRFYDAKRPGTQPGGLDSAEAVRQARAQHLTRVRAVFSGMDVFIFTLGLTEAWFHRPSGQVYATAPGTIAGAYDPALHGFANFRLAEVRADLDAALTRLRALNPGLRVLLTVSPVPLTATASGAHVLAASTLSKSVLRAAAGEMAADDQGIDYFPSFEMVTSAKAGAGWFEENLRSVKPAAVERVMAEFLRAHQGDAPGSAPADPRDDRDRRRSERQAARKAGK